MEVNKNSIEKKLQEQLEPSYLTVEDYSGCCGLKFDAVIVSKKFEGKPLLARQRFVSELLKDEMPHIHAFTQKTYTPDEWEKKQQKAMANPGCEAQGSGDSSSSCGNCKK